MKDTACALALLVAAASLGSCSSGADQPSTRSPPLKPATSCSNEIGDKAASVLVQQCVQVSPATHPPCNAANSCDLIRDEIKRGCDYLDRGAQPGFCDD